MTISGAPGSLATWCRQRYPMNRTILRTITSGCVFFDRIAAMILERFFGPNTSAIAVTRG
jgi:hypothetical protein